MSIFSIDFESFSRCDIRSAGTVKYASDESTLPLMLAIAVDDDEPVVWLPEQDRAIWGRDEWDVADDILEYLKNDLKYTDYVRAFNFSFEHYVMRYHMGIDIPWINWSCTQINARLAGYPESLAGAAKMACGVDKDSEGTRLIRKFACPISAGKRKGERRMPHEDPVEYQKFIDYCIQDVVVERELANKVEKFTPRRHAYDAMINTAVMNSRGVPINRGAAKHAIKIRDEATEEAVERFEKVVGCLPSQRAKCLEYFQANGYEGGGLTVAEVEDELENTRSLTGVAREMMEIRYHISGAAPKKLDAMVAMTMDDGTVKGAFAFAGASQTGRWSSKGLQVQNMKNPPSDMDTKTFFKLLEDRASLEEIRQFSPDIHKYIGCSIRHFVQGPFIACDYASIEARVLAWLAGDEELISDFEENVDVYVKMAAKVFHVKPSKVTKPQRQIGKMLVLGAGFGLSGGGFYKQAGNHIVDGKTEDEKKGLAVEYIDVWRDNNSAIVDYWEQCMGAAHEAMKHPGRVIIVGKCSYIYCSVAKEPHLLCRLPSGRCISYLRPEYRKMTMPWGDKQLALCFWCKNPHSVNYYWRSLYGGMLAQGQTQATAADVMMVGFNYLMKEGLDVRMLVHDEAVIMRPEWSGDYGSLCRHIERTMCCGVDHVPWMTGIPLEAEAQCLEYYAK